MSSWTAPITFTSSTLTAAQMNTEVRDHLNFLKGALDLITNSTTADTGNSVVMLIKRASASDSAFVSTVTADANNRFTVRADGQLEWGDGTAARDTNLYRAAASVLETDDRLDVNNAGGFRAISTGNSIIRGYLLAGDANPAYKVGSTGTTEWGDGGGSSADTNLFRSAANTLKTDDHIIATDGIQTRVVAGVVSDGSFTVTPASGAIAIDTTNSKIYVRVGATWKSVTVA